MPTPHLNTAVTLDSLLTHADWVRALARSLVADPASADDVEQEVWRAALEQPPSSGANPRGWLTSVARNAARALGRGRARRAQREAQAARAEALPATAELVAEAELSRELAAEVLALEEPYRTVLLLRFWRGLSPGEIARAQARSHETVRTQLKRGLERLRERLDRRFGDRDAWLAALAPLARETALPLAGGAGGGLLALSLQLGVAAALAGGVWWAWPAPDAPVSETVHVDSAAGASGTELELAVSASSPRAPADVAGTTGTRETSTASQATGARTVGSVIDLSGEPLVGLELAWQRKPAPGWPHWEGTKLILRREVVDLSARTRDLLRAHPEEADRLIAEVGDEPGFREVLLGIPVPRPTARTQVDGRFECDLGEGEWELELPDRRWTVVASSPRHPDWTLVVARCVGVAGVVVDETGKPIAEASLSFATRLESLAQFPRSTDAFGEHRVDAQSAADGSFALQRVPLVPGHTLNCAARGFEASDVDVPGTGSDSLRIVLKPSRAEARPTVAGLVLDAHGLPARGAFVRLGQDGATADEQGRFEFPLTTSHEGVPLTAMLPGFQPAVLEDFGENRAVSRSDVLLRLGPAALTITGRVLRSDGTPPKQGHLQVTDGTPCGSYGCYLEDAIEGHYQPGVELAADGSFVLGGLAARSYRLLAWDEAEGQLVHSEPIAAGTRDVLLQSRAEDFHERLTGCVRTRRGEAVEGAEVLVSMIVHRTPWSSTARPFSKAKTDSEGRFTLGHVPRSWATLSVSGEGVKHESVPVPESSREPLTITARLEVRTTAEVADERIDRLQFLDVEGRTVSPWIQWQDSISMQNEVPRYKGVFPVFDLGDDAVTVVLRQGRTEIRRVPIEVRRAKLLKLQL